MKIKLPKIGGGRVPAYEILVANHAVRNVIRDNKIYEIPNIIHTSLEEGMVPLDNPSAPNKLRCATLDGASYCN